MAQIGYKLLHSGKKLFATLQIKNILKKERKKNEVFLFKYLTQLGVSSLSTGM